MCSIVKWNVFIGILMTTIGRLKVALPLPMKAKAELSRAVATTSLTLQLLWSVNCTFWLAILYTKQLVHILQDICLRQESCEISDDNYESLTIISYVGISISIICLLVTIISLLTFK